MKRVLVISPHFPPINAADMHRVRHSLPYFRQFGWEAITVAVKPEYLEGYTDPQLLRTVPDDVEVHRIQAFNQRWTRFIGIGSLALRSILFYGRFVNRLLQNQTVDLVYFSTTMFPLLVLGPYWKKKFDVPYVIDMQDPWVHDYYWSRPRSERPPKYWFTYQLGKLLEPVAMRHVGAIISVTDAYCRDLARRYPNISPATYAVIPFGASEYEYSIAGSLLDDKNVSAHVDDKSIVGVYTGVCNSAMIRPLEVLFRAFKAGLEHRPDLFEKVHLRFIGTNYTPEKKARPVVLPIAKKYGIERFVHEETGRIPYMEALHIQRGADFLLLPGTLSPDYTPSKVYPYILSRTPILAFFNSKSAVVDTIRTTRSGEVVTFNDDTLETPTVHEALLDVWSSLLERIPFEPDTDWQAFKPFTAEEMTRRQVDVFNRTVA